jgi:hypothetical protein
MDEGTKELNHAIDGAELLFKNHSIETVATYDTVPLEVEVGITSALGRRYFELIHKLDQLMPLLQTLEIEEVITEKQVEQQRSRFKRIVLALSSMMRNFAMGCRRRMNEVDARKDEPEARKTRPSVDNGAAAGPGHVDDDPAESAALAAPEGEGASEVQVAGETVEIAPVS